MPVPIIAITIGRLLIKKSALSAIFKKDAKPIKLGLAPIRVYAKVVVNAPNMSKTVNTAGAKKITDIMRFARKELKRNTSVLSGKARSSWKLVGKGMRTTITNNVPYITLLDQPGYSKKASINGIYEPTLKAIRRKFK
jgi:hypothetical protein